jgi:hypothetical protein
MTRSVIVVGCAFEARECEGERGKETIRQRGV